MVAIGKDFVGTASGAAVFGLLQEGEIQEPLTPVELSRKIYLVMSQIWYRGSAAALASRHDGRVQPLAQICGQIVNLVGTIDLNRLARGVEGDLAVLAAAHMLEQIRAHLARILVVDQIVELG